MFFTACGGGDTPSADETRLSAAQNAAATETADKLAAESHQVQTPAGWQTVQDEGWTISFPPNWNVDPDTRIWVPGEVQPFRGRPDVSFFSASMPVMPPETFKERIKTRMGGEAQERTKVTIAGFSGDKCSREQNGKKHLGIFLEEKVAGGMILVHFFDCQAPVAEFAQHQAEFEGILNSIKK